MIMVVVGSPRARKIEVVPTCSSHDEPPEVGWGGGPLPQSMYVRPVLCKDIVVSCCEGESVSSIRCSVR